MNGLSNFWKLYGAGILRNPITDFEPMTDGQWKQLHALAQGHKLSGVVLDGISLLPTDMRPPKQILDMWSVEVAQKAHSHWDNNRVIADLFQRWREAGVRPVLLKGQGYARMYPSPSLRTIGDIDVFVCEAEFERSMAVVNALELDSDELPDIGKHIEFFYRKKGVELHRRSAEIFHRMDLDPLYQEWSEAVLPASTMGFYIDDKGSFADSGEWITTPPPTFNAFYTFMHMFGHMYIGSIHIRSIADWILLLKNYKRELDLTELKQRLMQFGLLEYWQRLGCFVVRYMGVDPDDIPFYNHKAMKHAARYYRYFGKELLVSNRINEANGTLVRKLSTLKHHWIFYYRRIGIYPFSTIEKGMVRILKFGIKGAIKHKS